MLSDRFSQMCAKISRCFNLDRQHFNPVAISLQRGETEFRLQPYVFSCGSTVLAPKPLAFRAVVMHLDGWNGTGVHQPSTERGIHRFD